MTPGTNVSVDLNSGINFTLAMGRNYTLDNPTNAKPGQAGFIKVTQDGTGSRTLAYGTNWRHYQPDRRTHERRGARN